MGDITNPTSGPRCDVVAPTGPGQMLAAANDHTRRLLCEMGRKEDVALAPGGHRLAVAAFGVDVVGLVDFDVERSASLVRFEAIGYVGAGALERPHGLVFADDSTLLVANRDAEVVLLELGDDPTVANSRVVLDRRSSPPVRSPGSLCAQWIGDDLLEVMVCNNYVHEVTRHVLDRRRGWAVVDGEVLIRHGLSVPDGIAIDRGGGWIAVSNHLEHEVAMYRYDVHLAAQREPDGVLHGLNYPHGLAFSADGRQLVVADAGLPYLFTFAASDGDWSGARHAAKITRVQDDETFHRGRHNPGEGGPKGVVVTASGAVIVVSEVQVAAFEIGDVFADLGTGNGAVAPRDTDDAETLDRWAQVSENRRARRRGASGGGRVEGVRRFRRRVVLAGVAALRWSGRRALRCLPRRAQEQVMHVADDVASFIRDDAL